MIAGALEIVSENPTRTEAIGATLADWLRDGDVVLLHGDLGAGKTTLAKGIAAALRVQAVVASPSFALVNEYETGLAAPVSRLYHLDLFRLCGEDDLASIGFDELASPDDGVTLVEWPERALGMLPQRYMLIELEMDGANRRRLRITMIPADGSWSDRFADLRARLASAETPP